MKDLLVIDGSQGEGGGQILRSALSLAVITGQPFAITKIRAGRKKPGLMRQHLTSVKAAATICQAECKGAELYSQELAFHPGSVRAGNYHFSVGTAGSTTLILQTILPPLLFADGPSTVVLEGGTHNPFAPPFEFLRDSFLPVLAKMGADIDIRLDMPGFNPAGGGKLTVTIHPVPALNPIALLDRGPLRDRMATAVLNSLPDEIGERELKSASSMLRFKKHEGEIRRADHAAGMGNVFFITLEYDHVTAVFTGFGERGFPAERVAGVAASAADRYLRSEAPADDYLADQLILPFALAGGGSFRAVALSRHFLTNQEIVQRFLPVQFHLEREDRNAWRIDVSKK